MNLGRYLRVGAFILGCVSCAATSAFAVDGVVLIDQARALAGNVTPGDAPGFPVSITLPGSYKLSGNLTVTAGSNGINVLADNVTIDLNGFQIAGADGGDFGVTDSSGRRGIAVRNGSVTNFFIGIQLGGTTGAEVTQVRAVGNTLIGISAALRSIVTGNSASMNGTGIAVGAGSIASGNNVFENETGLQVSANSSVLNNQSTRNGIGIEVTCAANLIGNMAVANDDNLVTNGQGCSFFNNHIPVP